MQLDVALFTGKMAAVTDRRYSAKAHQTAQRELRPTEFSPCPLASLLEQRHGAPEQRGLAVGVAFLGRPRQIELQAVGLAGAHADLVQHAVGVNIGL